MKYPDITVYTTGEYNKVMFYVALDGSIIILENPILDKMYYTITFIYMKEGHQLAYALSEYLNAWYDHTKYSGCRSISEPKIMDQFSGVIAFKYQQGKIELPNLNDVKAIYDWVSNAKITAKEFQYESCRDKSISCTFS